MALAVVLALLPGVAGTVEPLPVSEVAPGVFVHRGAHAEAAPENEGGIANVGFIVGPQAVAVIDTGGSARQGRRLRAAIRAVTDRPIRYVINTHVHPDHLLGNAAFAEDDPIFVGHAKLPQALAARGPFYLARLREQLGPAVAEGARILPPTRTVAARDEIDLGGRVLRLTAHPTAHTDNDLTVHDVESGTLWTGDLLFVDRVPAIDGSLKGWLEAIAALRRVEAARAVPGHGPPTADWPEALDAQERYLRTLLEEIRAVLASGGTIEAASATVGQGERDRWLLFEQYNPRNVIAAFAELEWE